MPNVSIKALLGTAVAVVIATSALASSAQAACVWTGADWNCGSLPAPPPEQSAYVYAPAPNPPAPVPYPASSDRYPGPKVN